MPDDDLLQFKVVKKNSHNEVGALAINLLIGRAAYETSRPLFLNDRVDYWSGA
jgi:hypothetical protein